MNIEISRGLGIVMFRLTERQLVAAPGPPDEVLVTGFNNRNT